MDIILIFGDQQSTSPAVQGAVLNLLSTMDFGNTSVTRMKGTERWPSQHHGRTEWQDWM